MEQEFHPNSATAVDRAARLLLAVLAADEPRGATELAAAVELPKSTASRLLAVLEQHGLVAQHGRRGRFTLGPSLMRLAHRGIDRSIVELAQQPMHALAEATGETINLAVAGPHGVVHLDQVDSSHFLGAGQWVGQRVPYHCSANGKVLLAFGAAELAEEERLEALTSRTIVDRPRLAAELERVRGERFATATDELEIGLTAVAGPVFDETGSVIAALSVSGPTLRLSARRVRELRPMVTKQCRALSEALGHRHEGVHVA